MNAETLDRAKKEALRFVDRIRAYQAAACDGGAPGKDRAAVRRASMDLTRTLADLRQGR